MTPAQLYIAKGGAEASLALPIDAVTRTFGIFGQRGTGKTSTAVVLAEEMARKGAHVVVLDPVGAWWGITHDGEGKGLPGIVLGGEHGDVPLEEQAGKLVADLVVGRHWPVVVIDMKLLRKGARQRFLADFLEEVYFTNREPLHVFFEEADQALPQSPRGMDPTVGRVLGAAEDIVKLGRGRGLGASLISQRFATVNKNVVEQVETLLLHRLIGPNDRKAAKGWVESNGDADATDRVLGSLAGLAVGEAQLYSPGWLRELRKIRVRQRKTFDSSATPEVGAAPVEATKRAPVNLDELRVQMAETVQRARENDPKVLKARIAELEAEVERAVNAQPVPERILVPDREAVRGLLTAIANLDGAGDEIRQMLDQAFGEFAAMGTRLSEALAPVAAQVATIDAVINAASALPEDGQVEKAPARPDNGPDPAVGRGQLPPAPSRPAADNGGPGAGEPPGDLSAGAWRLLDEMRGLAPLRLSRTQLATMLKRGARSSTLTQQLAELKAAGAIEQDHAGRIWPVSSPVANAPAMNEEQAREMWLRVLPDGPAALLRALLAAPAFTLSRGELFEAGGFSQTSSTPVTHLKLLSDNGLVRKSGGFVELGDLMPR